MITVLTGGTGGAKFVDGLRQVVAQEELTIIVNTGDDLLWWGLYVSPDVDSITYVLAGLLSKERGWGVKGDTFQCLQAMGQLGQPIWFHTGDRDLAVHLVRSQLLAHGMTLSQATAEIANSFVTDNGGAALQARPRVTVISAPPLPDQTRGRRTSAEYTHLTRFRSPRGQPAFDRTPVAG